MEAMKQIVLIVFLLVATVAAHAQIGTNEQPWSFKNTYRTRSAIDVRVMPNLDLERIELEDALDEQQGFPPRFGFPHETCINTDNSGTWQELPNGDKLWQLSIRCPGALSINLLYDRFYIPNGGKLFLYTADKRQTIGAFTEVNNNGTAHDLKGFATGLLYGDEIILEYYEPKIVADPVVISIARVVHGYRYIKHPNTRSLGSSGNCQVNVNCEEGHNWQLEKNAVALILVNGIRNCTGALINTTANDGRPLFLTANHCLVEGRDAINNPNLQYWTFYWHYEAPGCSNIASEPTILATSGATVVANNAISDFALLRLTEDPRKKQGVTPYYLGWDRTDNPSSSGVGIHHPRGDVKKIATYDVIPSKSNCFNQIEYDKIGYIGYRHNNDNFWRVIWKRTANGHSVTEGGSSGSPLISSNRKIIGQLYGSGFCPNPNCSNPSADIANYGKFSVSWTGGGATDNRRKLQPWLDPQNTNPQSLDGVAALPPIFLIGPTQVCTEATFTLSNLPAGASVQWSTGGGRWNALELASGQGTAKATYRAANIGQGTVSATVSLNGATTTLSQKAWAGIPIAELEVNSDGIGRASACLKHAPLNMHAGPPVWQLWNPSQQVNFVVDDDGGCGKVRGAAGDWNIRGTVTVRNGCGEATGRFSMSGTSQTDPCPRLIEQRGSGSNLTVMYTKPIDCPVWPIRGAVAEQPVAIEVYDRMGRLLLRHQGEQVSLGSLRPGLYIVRARSGEDVATLTVVR